MAENMISLATKGVGGTDEDWWYLVTEPSGDSYVLHEWSYLSLNNLKTDSGSKKIGVDDFLKAAGSYGAAVSALKKHLRRDA